GTAAGTTLVKDIVPGSGGITFSDPVNLNGTLFFRAATPDFGSEIWRSNGTAAGTYLVKDIRPGSAVSQPSNSASFALVASTNFVYFAANDGVTGSELWRTDGTDAGTILLADISSSAANSPREVTDVNGTVYFVHTDTAHGAELWKTDGT